jgi:hypothetical protein
MSGSLIEVKEEERKKTDAPLVLSQRASHHLERERGKTSEQSNVSQASIDADGREGAIDRRKSESVQQERAKVQLRRERPGDEERKTRSSDPSRVGASVVRLMKTREPAGVDLVRRRCLYAEAAPSLHPVGLPSHSLQLRTFDLAGSPSG